MLRLKYIPHTVHFHTEDPIDQNMNMVDFGFAVRTHAKRLHQKKKIIKLL